ncbi:MAG: restriction endonuclease [Candidatus Promineifilaceae bacterium]|nr:restriction endonuclease [Candidatus Promineifilaceae bacterium]
MLVRVESKLQKRSKLQRTSEQKLIWAWLGFAFALLLLWLTYHYLVRPSWLNLLPRFFSEFLYLIELASITTLATVATVYRWRQRRKGQSLTTVTVEMLYNLSPADFEKYVGELFRKKGYRVKMRGQKGDRGVDLILSQANGRMAVVQCKRYRHTIGPDIVRELFGTMIHERVHHAFLVTTADISDAAREWAKFKPMTLIDGPTLVEIAAALQTPVSD